MFLMQKLSDIEKYEIKIDPYTKTRDICANINSLQLQ
jgi:hypothetical protein